ncbi:IS200/IS605 family transposase [Methanosarcina sp. WH1]|uniref:IS200/IS605 family transposase n=1 Tax=Methanosarcina sp. WH1 TaxID=1434102 RepID=UPI00064EF997|nr:IS200/IS605 family transposase [Methanosarcina sp. WH1]
MDLKGHFLYSPHYHLIQYVKYRRKALTNPLVVDFLKTKIYNISETFDVEVLNIECDEDYFHLLFSAKPSLDIPKYINTIKTITSREIRKNFPEVKTMLWKDTVWSRSYFIASTGQVIFEGQVTLDILKQYVENQGKYASDEEDKDQSN